MALKQQPLAPPHTPHPTQHTNGLPTATPPTALLRRQNPHPPPHTHSGALLWRWISKPSTPSCAASPSGRASCLDRHSHRPPLPLPLPHPPPPPGLRMGRAPRCSRHRPSPRPRPPPLPSRRPMLPWRLRGRGREGWAQYLHYSLTACNARSACWTSCCQSLIRPQHSAALPRTCGLLDLIPIRPQQPSQGRAACWISSQIDPSSLAKDARPAGSRASRDLLDILLPGNCWISCFQVSAGSHASRDLLDLMLPGICWISCFQGSTGSRASRDLVDLVLPGIW